MTRKQWIAASLLIICSFVSNAQVKTGIEVLRERKFDILQGKRVGLCTNPTGVDRNLVSTIDILWESKDVNLVALYGPEHGVRGNIYAGDHVENEVDKRTGLKMYSLYGKTSKPTRLTDLHSLAVLLFQILFAEHPLNGSKEYNMPMHQMDEKEIARELYSYEKAQFIFADSYDLNRYICEREPAHVNARELWKMYPQFIRDLFIKAFVIGIKNAN